MLHLNKCIVEHHKCPLTELSVHSVYFTRLSRALVASGLLAFGSFGSLVVRKKKSEFRISTC